MLSDFIALTESINNKLIKCQGMLKEVVLETDVIKALTYLESLILQKQNTVCCFALH